MNKYQEAINALCKSIYPGHGTVKNVPQIVIDIIQDRVEDMLEPKQDLRRDDVGAMAYEISILIEAMDATKFADSIEVLQKIIIQLNEWEKDIEWRNGVLGLPKES